MDTTPLPTQDYDPSDSDQVLPDVYEDELVHYVVRITPCEKFSFDDLKSFIEEEPQICRYVIGQELIPQVHYHLVLSLDQSLDIQEVKDIIRAFVTPYWNDPKTGKCPRGFGNKQYNLQVAKDIDMAISYAIKESDTYVYEGYTLDYMNQRKSASFQKKTTASFTIELEALRNEFSTTDMEVRTFMTRFLNLKGKYDQQSNFAHAYGYALSALFKRNPEVTESYVEDFLYKQ